MSEVETAIERGETYIGRAVDRRKDGTVFDIEGKVTQLVYRGAMHYLIVARDVTEQIKAYELLEQRVDEIEGLFEVPAEAFHPD